MVSRHAFTFLSEGMKFRAGRLYETFWNSQSNLKWGMVVVWPSYLFYIRCRAETQYKYHVYLENGCEPKYHSRSGLFHLIYSGLFGAGVVEGGGYWKNGSVFWGNDKLTIGGLKNMVYEGDEQPEKLRVGCRGRIMEDTDNLAIAVKNFCRRDPRILMWTEG